MRYGDTKDVVITGSELPTRSPTATQPAAGMQLVEAEAAEAAEQLRLAASLREAEAANLAAATRLAEAEAAEAAAQAKVDTSSGRCARRV